MIHASYQAYLDYKAPAKKYPLQALSIKKQGGGFIMRAHNGNKPTVKFFEKLEQVKEWLRENTNYK